MDPAAALPPPEPPPIYQPPSFPGFWGAVGLLALMQIAAPLPILIPFIIAGQFTKNPDLYQHPAIMAAAALAGAVCVIWVYCSQTRTKFVTLGGSLRFRPALLFPIALAVAGLLMVEIPIAAGVLYRFPFLDPKMDFGFAQSPVSAFVLIVLVAPWTEEYVFRGIFLRGFIPRYGETKAVLLSAALFAAVHYYPVRLPGMFVAGILLAFLAIRVGSLWPGIVAHMLNNVVAMVGLVTSPADEKPGDLWIQMGPAVAAAIVVGGLALLAAGVYGVRRGTMET